MLIYTYTLKAIYLDKKVRNKDRKAHQKETHSNEWVFISSSKLYFSEKNI